ncbi:hypothetical protein [Diaphorobacter ruginosibacter]|uniref:hypothetical protein n=1 Tax=Diaphorobacter ruginosibacter TaxID=1715720 RepID=UPI00333F9B9A
MTNCPSRPYWIAKLPALLLACSAGWALAAGPAAQPGEDEQARQVQAERDAERSRIQAQRKEISERLKREEAACYKKFVVDSCLRDARYLARQQDNELRNQELKLNEAERHEKAADRRAFIEQNEQHQQEKIEAGEDKADAMDPAARAQSREQEQSRRLTEAQQRAAGQQSKEAAHARDEAKRQAQEPSRVERARMRYEAKQRKAEERRIRHEKDLADAARSGKKPAASLPEPSN